jgi:hypothetical protein
MPHINDLQKINDEPVVTFGLLTDIQYADVEDGTNYVNTRYYRNSLNLIRDATEEWKRMPNFKFIIQLGEYPNLVSLNFSTLRFFIFYKIR